MFILVDCNNFYASCERFFNPKLKNKPIVVLSNNDGCVIARSHEAKSLGVKMGAAIFEYKELISGKNVCVFSSNFALYADMSMRIMQTIESFSYHMEIYSIDEAFLYIDDKNTNFEKIAAEIKKRVYKWTGIAVSIGIGKTKTLSKLASEIAKKKEGVFLLDEKNVDDILSNTSIEDIWGIGKNITKKANLLNIYSALDLKNSSEELIKKKLTINILKTQLELKGISCYPLNESPFVKKSITTSRSFIDKIDNIEKLLEKISSFTSMAAQKLRKENLQTNFLTVYISTSFYSKDPSYFNSCHVKLPIATSFTPTLISYAKTALEKIYKEGFLYKKAGVILGDFSSEDALQQDLFSKLDDVKKKYLMKIVDNINYKANKKAIFFASEGIEKPVSSAIKSQKFTTSFDNIIKAK